MLPISGIPLKYVNYILLFGYEHHNKYKPSIMIQSFHDAELSATILRHKSGQI